MCEKYFLKLETSLLFIVRILFQSIVSKVLFKRYLLQKEARLVLVCFTERI